MKDYLLVALALAFLLSLYLIEQFRSRLADSQFEYRISQMWKSQLVEDLAQAKGLLRQLRTRLAEDLELWSRFESLAQSPKAKEMAQEKVKQLQSQLAAVKDLL
jgi:Zn-dependent oligopeptidase